MPRTTKTITISLPPEMAEQIERIIEEEGKTKSELFREAMLLYMEDREWKRVLRYGEERARERGIRREDIGRIVNEYRAKAQQSS